MITTLDLIHGIELRIQNSVILEEPTTLLMVPRGLGPAHLQDLVLLRLVDLSSQAAVGDGIVDDWLVGLGAGLLE